MELSEALATIGAAMPTEARDAQIRERRLNLAASGTALAVDLGVAGLPTEQREATETQLIAIGAEIARLANVASVPAVDAPVVASMGERLTAIESAVDILILDSLGGSDV